MALYNPSHEYVLGQEWVPVRQPGVQFNRFDNPFEVGHTFRTNASSTTVAKAIFYLQQYSPGFTLWQPYTAALYEIDSGNLLNQGDIRKVVIPVSNNTTYTNPGNGTVIELTNCNTIQQALMDPSSDSFLLMTPSSQGQAALNLHFNVSLYNNVLNGSRILNVNFLYSGTIIPNPAQVGNRTDLLPGYSMFTSTVSDFVVGTPGLTGPWVIYPFLDPSVYKDDDLNRISLGDVNPFYNSTSIVENVNVAPWAYSELLRFDSTAASGIAVNITTVGGLGASESVQQFEMTYAALEIYYCEEQRSVYGTKMIGPRFSNHTNVPLGSAGHDVTGLWWQNDENQILMRNPASVGSTNPTIAGGEYLLTLSQGSVGDQVNVSSKFHLRPPEIVACRQYYQIPGIKGYQLNHPVPNDDTILGQIITPVASNVLPQMTLADGSNNVITQVHAYGKQVAADVYNGVIATQIIDMNPTGNGTDNATYSNVRFYARRFGSGRRPLVLNCQAPTLSGIGKQVSIDAFTFDQLPEIVDGWKEVTLTFPTTPTMGTSATGNVTWQFSSTDGSGGGEWQVLGCSSIGLSANPTNNLQLMLNPASNAANYGGTAVDAAWVPGISPLVTTASADVTTDLSLMFFRDYSAPNLTVVQQVQPLSGIGLACGGVAPPGVPTGLYYNQLIFSDSPTASANGTINRDHIMADNFQRTVTNGWGAQWTSQIGSTATAFQDVGTKATLHADTSSVYYFKSVTGQSYDLTSLHALFSIDAYNSTNMSVVLVARGSSSTNNYKFHLNFNGTTGITQPAGNDELVNLIIKTSGGSDTVLGAIGTRFQKPAVGQKIHMKVVCWFSLLQMKTWLDGDDEPDNFDISVFDSTFATGFVGLGGSVSNGTADYSFYKFFAGEVGQDGNKLVVQRSDTVETTFKTIMSNSDLTIQSFNDYEARVGIPTTYRLCMQNQYNVLMPFTTAAPVTLPAFGAVTNGAGFGVGSHILLFTTNSDQTGNSNLAYSSVWDGAVSEPFTFVEGSSFTLQAMYGKDFFTAFHATERGGDRFQRQILVQAAAISPETLADFTSLRNMAWSDAPYICVRDEDGNRWLAAVMVPSANVTHNRTIYIAALDIVEVTSTPDQTDPGASSTGF